MKCFNVGILTIKSSYQNLLQTGQKNLDLKGNTNVQDKNKTHENVKSTQPHRNNETLFSFIHTSYIHTYITTTND